MNAKAKISAALFARNRKNLLAKLEQLGITEEEHQAQKQKRKVLNERKRRKRINEREKLEKEAMLQAHGTTKVIKAG